jgi:hypothetical protein
MVLMVVAVMAGPMISGCAAGSGDSAGPDRASGTTATPAAGASPNASSPTGPGDGPGTPAPVRKGEVTVTPAARGYAVGHVVRATVANGMDRAVYTEDFKTDCAIAFLQRHEPGGWVDVLGCRLGRPTLTVAIGPGMGRDVAFDPRGVHLAGGPGGTGTGPGFGAGTYRVRFTYRLEPDPGGGQDSLVAYSAEFAIR